jgi:DNA repair protein RadA/Sms
MLLAVLEKRCSLKLSDADVYVSTVGGIRLTEPAADLAIALAIASAVREKALPATLAAVGEISLAGEIRPVTAARIRAAEAKRLGYTEVLDGDAGTLNAVVASAFARGAAASGDRPAF